METLPVWQKIKHLDITPTKLDDSLLMSHFRDQGARSLYGATELQVVMFDTAGLLPFGRSK